MRKKKNNGVLGLPDARIYYEAIIILPIIANRKHYVPGTNLSTLDIVVHLIFTTAH